MIFSSLTALSGILSFAGGAVSSYFSQKQKNTHDLQLAEIQIKRDIHELAIMGLEAEAADKRAIIETSRMESQQEMDRFTEELTRDTVHIKAAYKSETADFYRGESTLLIIADFIRKTVRPFVTYILILSLLTIAIMRPGEQEYIIAVTGEAAILAVGFWFGSRGTDKHADKK